MRKPKRTQLLLPPKLTYLPRPPLNARLMVRFLPRNNGDIGWEFIGVYWRLAKNKAVYPFTMNQREYPLTNPKVNIFCRLLHCDWHFRFLPKKFSVAGHCVNCGRICYRTQMTISLWVIQAMITWLEITVTTVPANAEQVHGLLDTLGCIGTAQNFESDKVARVVGYLPATEDATEKLVWLQEQIDFALARGWLFNPVSVTTRVFDSEEWEAPLREVLPPLPIGERFLVVITGDEVDSPENRIVLKLRSLGGFGTGHHPTTRMCLEFLEQCQIVGKRVLDVGTGSGILAIAAAKLGASEVIATDIDDAALEAAQENAERNGVAEKINFVKSDLLRQVRGQFDIVVSNLLTPLIKDLAWQLKSQRALAPEGLWIGSGVSAEGWKEVKPLLGKLGYRVVKERELSGWIAFVAIG